ncbi:hypothetical protein PG994_015347 [Apiospora phragmitis]|uniref:Uncharacterized protein n=1 Tax=Apiospora phragmitis TaxID=2905665 RepID=A0ABR1SR95_9PEZI
MSSKANSFTSTPMCWTGTAMPTQRGAPHHQPGAVRLGHGHDRSAVAIIVGKAERSVYRLGRFFGSGLHGWWADRTLDIDDARVPQGTMYWYYLELPSLPALYGQLGGRPLN